MTTANPYDLLKVDSIADDAAIRSAYRRQARGCHPDKKRATDGQQADSRAFVELCEALECLLDEGRRRGLDAQLCAAKAREEKLSKLDASRRRFKSTLEETEKRVVKDAASNCDVEARLTQLRREAADLLAASQDDLAAAFSNLGLKDKSDPLIKVKWGKTESCDAAYTAESLGRIFGKYGEVAHVVMMRPNGRRALIEFRELAAAKIAFNCESGMSTNPLELTALFSDTVSRYITVQCARTNKSLIDYEDVIIEKLLKHSDQ